MKSFEHYINEMAYPTNFGLTESVWEDFYKVN